MDDELRETALVWQQPDSNGLSTLVKSGKVESKDHRQECLQDIHDSLETLKPYFEKIEQERSKLKNLLKFVQTSLDTDD